jgi:hypothetical protein
MAAKCGSAKAQKEKGYIQLLLSGIRTGFITTTKSCQHVACLS